MISACFLYLTTCWHNLDLGTLYIEVYIKTHYYIPMFCSIIGFISIQVVGDLLDSSLQLTFQILRIMKSAGVFYGIFVGVFVKPDI